jgi:DNA polymerase sigma
VNTELRPLKEDIDAINQAYIEIKALINSVLKHSFNDRGIKSSDLVIYGSAASGLMTRGSADLDLNLILHEENGTECSIRDHRFHKSLLEAIKDRILKY